MIASWLLVFDLIFVASDVFEPIDGFIAYPETDEASYEKNEQEHIFFIQGFQMGCLSYS